MYSTATGSFRPDYAGFEELVYTPGSRVRSIPTRPDLRDVPIRVPRSEVKAAPAVPVRAPGSEVTAAPMESLSLLLFFLCLQPLLCLLLLTLRLLFNLILKSLRSPELQEPEIAEDGPDQEPDGAAVLPRSFAEQIKMGHMKLRSSTRK